MVVKGLLAKLKPANIPTGIVLHLLFYHFGLDLGAQFAHECKLIDVSIAICHGHLACLLCLDIDKLLENGFKRNQNGGLNWHKGRGGEPRQARGLQNDVLEQLVKRAAQNGHDGSVNNEHDWVVDWRQEGARKVLRGPLAHLHLVPDCLHGLACVGV